MRLCLITGRMWMLVPDRSALAMLLIRCISKLMKGNFPALCIITILDIASTNTCKIYP